MGFSIGWLQQGKTQKAAAAVAYRHMMQAALAPDFYAAGAVPDTFDGRGQMVTLYSALAARRLRAIGSTDARKIAARLNTLVLDGFDAAFREQGVGDSSIARKVRALAEAYYGLGTALNAALDTGDADQVAAVLVRNGMAGHDGANTLTAHIRQQSEQIAAQPDSEILAGEFAWSVLSGALPNVQA